MKIGSDYDPEWIDHQFKTYIQPYCNGQGGEDFRPAQQAFLNCLSEGLAPRASAKLLKDKLENLLGAQTEAKESTTRTRASLDYLNFQIGLMDNPQPQPRPAQSYRHTITVKGDSEILDFMAANLRGDGDPFRFVKHSDPSDVELTGAQMQEMRRGKPIRFGTTRLEISFNGDLERMKQFILKKFPQLTII